MQMHWCTARVNLSGQGFTNFWYDDTQLITWPEVQVIMLMHGEENVYDVAPRALGWASIASEKERLIMKYGYKPVEASFPGRTPRMEMLMPGDEGRVLPKADEWGKIIYEQPVQVAALELAPNGQPTPGEDPGPVNPPAAPRPDGENNDEEEDDSAKQPMADVTAGAVFKPGKHPRPHKGA